MLTSLLHALQWEIHITTVMDFLFKKTAKSIPMKLSLISFGTNKRIAAKFQTGSEVSKKIEQTK